MNDPMKSLHERMDRLDAEDANGSKTKSKVMFVNEDEVDDEFDKDFEHSNTSKLMKKTDLMSIKRLRKKRQFPDDQAIDEASGSLSRSQQLKITVVGIKSEVRPIHNVCLILSGY
ncbi:hypothetical protein L6452_36801 [Arctium lappa]|uniref:Uncharacterized protein n=1 Tax=Arctium lappa TaxID=4217 RepID=A0ACB8Y1X1_ARCLA|nr:hypothetical protein L6452_36801 [Arctium lappa]